jgi:hypothetical protein
VKNKARQAIGVHIDKLTNSIENISTGEVFDTVITQLQIKDSKQLVTKSWKFDWHSELKAKTKLVYKLTTVNNPNIIQGLLSREDKQDHIFMHLIESSIFNIGIDKIYLGVPGNLIAFACKVSVDMGYQGFVAYDAKSALIKHYQNTLFATHFRWLRMFIDNKAADRLILQ